MCQIPLVYIYDVAGRGKYARRVDKIALTSQNIIHTVCLTFEVDIPSIPVLPINCFLSLKKTTELQTDRPLS